MKKVICQTMILVFILTYAFPCDCLQSINDLQIEEITGDSVLINHLGVQYNYTYNDNTVCLLIKKEGSVVREIVFQDGEIIINGDPWYVYWAICSGVLLLASFLQIIMPPGYPIFNTPLGLILGIILILCFEYGFIGD